MTDPIETGFGSPDDEGLDVGFGSPDDLGPMGGDTGFGSPATLTGATLSAREVADDGGEILTLTGDFSVHPGAYRVTIIDGDATEYPCYGAIQGQGYTCWPNRAKTELKFVTPPLPIGTVDIQIEGATTELLENALTVVYRVWHSGVYGLRSMFPSTVFRPGAQQMKREGMLV